MNSLLALKKLAAAVLRVRPLCFAIILAPMLSVIVFCAQACAEIRSLKLYFLHTGEKAEIAFKQNGRYLPDGLSRLNHFLRDWRRNEPARMDPRLFDLVWQVYHVSGSHDYIHVVSGYRSPGTNSILRSRSRGVAKHSQHMLGRAMDFFIPDVPLKKLRYIGMSYQSGGVGYYPTSGSPFVHIDVGNVRHWPRMNRHELLAMFPDGKTIHVPSDGRPLPGYEQALAAYEARTAKGSSIAIADASQRRKPKTLFATLFGGGRDEEEDKSESKRTIAIASATQTSLRAKAQLPVIDDRDESGTLSSSSTAMTMVAAVPIPVAAPSRSSGTGSESTSEPSGEIPSKLPFQLKSLQESEADLAALQRHEGQAILASAVPIPAHKPQSSFAAASTGSTLQSEARMTSAGANNNDSEDTKANVIQLAKTDQLISTKNSFVPIPLNKPQSPSVETLIASADIPELRLQSYAEETAPNVNRDVIAKVIQDNMDAHTLSSLYSKNAQGTVSMLQNLSAERELSAKNTPVQHKEKIQKAVADKLAVIDTGVRTTEKSARLQHRTIINGQKAASQTANVAVSQLAPSLMQISHTVPRSNRVLYNEMLRATPTTVYTAGFQRYLPSGDTNKFTGKAVTFLSIARFLQTN